MALPRASSRWIARARWGTDVILAAALLAVAMVCAAPLAARADDTERAREHFERGVALYEEGGYDAALVEFLQAYELSSNYRILFNIGQIHFQLNDYAEALRSFERYLGEGGDDVPAARRRLVEQDVATLRERVGTLELDVNVDGATVLLDDVAIGTTPLEPLIVNIGRHVLRIDAAGYRSDTQRITIASGARLELEVELQPGSGVTPLAPDRAVRSGASGRDIALWTLGATTLLAGAGAGVAFGLAFDANQGLGTELDRFPADAGAVEAERERLRAASLAADILGAVALASATAFVIVLAATEGGSEGEAAAPEARLELGPSRVAVSGRF